MGARKRNSSDAIKELNKNLVIAKLNNCPTSPRKMRLVADQVRGKKLIKLFQYSSSVKNNHHLSWKNSCCLQ